MKEVGFFKRMNKKDKALYLTTVDSISRGLSLSKSSYGGMHHTDGQGVLFNAVNDDGERFIFKKNCCWFYLDFDNNTLESIDEKILAVSMLLTDYDTKYGKVFEIEPVDDKKGFYLGKIDFIIK